MFAAILQQLVKILATKMSVLRHNLCHFLLLLLIGISTLQFAAAHTEHANPPLLAPLTTEQGLISGTINRLYIDSTGFLWLATDRGLNRFDAYKVQQLPR